MAAVWCENDELVCVATDDSYLILKFDEAALARPGAGRPRRDGVKTAVRHAEQPFCKNAKKKVTDRDLTPNSKQYFWKIANFAKNANF